ncbi:MAG: ubiquinol-cytochrome c reductase iron-sulfur subunit [Chloroflexi bacterium]|nr:ubiquinol-cytochrome c reductase iron-sulfur subunit [Chloroflexota bacterium]
MAVLHQVDGARGAQMSRRWFMRAAWGTGMLLLLAQVGGAFVDFFRPRKIGAFGTELAIGTADQFPVGSITRFTEGKFYVSHVPEGFLAFYQKCPHLGCTVPWEPTQQSEDKVQAKGRFNCPCHASIYNRYGEIVAGPAPRPLDLMQVRVEGGKVYVHTGKITQRGIWQPDQAVKA